jgi:hypothetical protein
MRLYKKTWNLRQICNIAVYMIHSACTIHLLNLPEKTAKRDITHGVKHLEEIAEDWLCARRTLSILSVLARKWNCELPEDAAFVLQRADEKYGYYNPSDVPSPRSNTGTSPTTSDGNPIPKAQRQYSPLTQYPSAQLFQNSKPLALGDEMVMDQPSQSPNNLIQRQNVPSDTTRLQFDAETLADWNQPSIITPSSRFQQPQFASNSASPVASAPRRPQPQMRQSSSNMGLNMDSQDWFLSDSARWQQGFEGWETSQNQQNSSMFVFGEKQPMADSTLQNEEGEQLPNFGDLGSLASGSGWLPGLD